MQHLGGADAVEHLAAEVRREALAHFARQRLARRHAAAQCDLVACRQVLRGKHRRVQRRHAEKHAWSVLHQSLEYGRRRRPLSHQHHGCAGRKRKGQRIAEPIGKEELGGGEHHIVLSQSEHLPPIGFIGPVEVRMRMHRTLGTAGRSRRVEPEGDVVAAGRGRRLGSACLADPCREFGRVVRQRTLRAHDHHQSDLVGYPSQGLRQRGQQGARHQQHLRPAMRHHVGVVVHG